MLLQRNNFVSASNPYRPNAAPAAQHEPLGPNVRDHANTPGLLQSYTTIISVVMLKIL
jgi:hypothetical protein